MLLSTAHLGRGRRERDGLIRIFVVGGDGNPSCAPEPLPSPPQAHHLLQRWAGKEGQKEGSAGASVFRDTPGE